MAKFIAQSDISNPGQVISKDYGANIPAGSELDLNSDERNVKRLVDLGALITPKEAEKNEEPPADPPGDPDETGNPPAHFSQLPDDIHELRAIADENGIEYPKNIGVEKLKAKIASELAE